MNLLQRAALRLAGITNKDLAALHPEAFTRELLFSGYSNGQAADATAPLSNAYGEFLSHPWIYKATRTVALAFRQVPVYVMRAEQYVEGHPVEQLLTKPNPAMSGSALWERWITDVYLAGEIGLEAVGRGASVVELWPRRGLNVTVSHPSRYPVASSYTIKDASGEYKLPPEEFIWAWLYNPLREFRGLGVFQAAALGIQSDRNAQKYAASFFKGMARPDYVVMTPQGTTVTEQQMLLSQIEAMTSGKNKGIVMEQGITDIKPLSFAPKDIIWETIRQMSREEVGAVAGVPGELMGDKAATYENRKEAVKSFWFDTMQPLCRWRDELLTNFFRARGALRDTETLESDFSGVEALEQSYADRVAYATSMIALGVSLADANQMFDLGIPDTSLQAAAAADAAAAAAPPEPATAPAPTPTAPARSIEDVAIETKSVDIPPVDDMATAIPFGGERHLAILDVWEKAMGPREARFNTAVKRLLAELGRDVMRRIEAPTKDINAAKDEPFDLAKWQRLFRLRLTPQVQLTVAEAGRDAMAELNVGISFDVTNPEVLNYMRERQNKLSGIADTTFERLRAQIIDGIDQGDTIDEIKARIVEETQGAIAADRARTIARTEVNGAANGGKQLAWDQSGVVTEKQWIAALNHLPPDPNPVRDTHVEAHGQIVGQNENFKVGDGEGPYPGGIGLPEEDINCRCTMVAVIRPGGR